MAYDLGSATFTVGVNLKDLVTGLSTAKGMVLGLGTGFVAASLEAVKMAGNFQQANTQLVTSAGESQKNLAMVSAGILKVSTDTGTTTQQLQAAMYTIESSGAHGKTALDDLAAAARGAKTENADLSDVANAETTIMTDYASKHITAANAINDLIATVSRGKTHLQDLAASFSAILPTANSLGVSLYDVSGAMATMTGEGVPAADAATYLRQTLMALENPGTKAKNLLADIGLTANQVADEMKVSLPDTLALIEEHLKHKFPEGSAAYNDALATIAGGTKTMQGLLDLTGTHLQTFKDNVDQITQSVKQSGTQISGWNEIQGNFNFQLDKLHTQLDAVAIKLGTTLMPIVSQFISQEVMPAISNFEAWESQTHGVENAFEFLTTALKDVIGVTETLLTDAGNLIQGFEAGDPVVANLAGALTTLATAVGLIKIEEVVAGWVNWFQEMQQGAGFIANLAGQALPELNQAFGWTKVAAAGVATEVTTIGTEAVVAEGVVTGAAVGMQLALGAATLGISLLVGGLVAGLISSKQQLVQFSADTKKEFDSLGKSASDNQAKVAASAAQNAHEASGHWSVASAVMAQKMDGAKAQMILDQQKIADAAMAAAQKADDAWTKASQDMSIVSLLASQGFTGPEIQKYLAGSGTNTNPVSVNTGPTIGRQHAAGGIIGPGEFGFVSEAGTGGELVQGLPGGGARVYTGAQSRAMLGGGGGGYVIENHTHVYFDSTEVAHVIGNRQDQIVRAKLGPRSRLAA